jgi:HD-GYP domain-containing protein (c-di-GMP phosphodiesterase class II)/DNA-binding CsgD family transcriptional regulator
MRVGTQDGGHRPGDRPPGELPVVEVLAALSLTTDLASGLPFEKGLQTCLVATAFSAGLGWSEQDRRVVFQAALLRAVGCTSHASENADLFADDVAFQAALKQLDPGDGAVFGAQLREFGSWAPGRQAELVERFAAIAPVEGPAATRAGCEVSRALGVRLGLEPEAVAALDQVYERWDGLGLPDGVRGEALLPAARAVHVAEQAVLAFAAGGMTAAVAEVTRRSGGHLDPDLAAGFAGLAEQALAPLGSGDLLAAVVAAEPGPRARVPFGDLHRLCLALAAVADLKGRFLLGHSTGVAELAAAGASAAGLPAAQVDLVRAAGLVHDLGRVAVSSEVWDRPGPLGAADLERVRLHCYWTARILQRCPALEPLAQAASSHHERNDGGGYHRGVPAGELPLTARLVAAADVLQALTQPRPYRPALPPGDAARLLADEVRAGRLDAEACDAVLAAAGLPRPRRSHPCDLTEREVEVLRLAARGLTNRQIAGLLAISDRTVGHHLAHVFDKTGRRTRAGVAVFAMEHGLLP